MKPNRSADALAAALTSAAATPVPLPPRAAPPANDPAPPALAIEPVEASVRRAAKKAKAPLDTVGITLRPDRALLLRYTNEAADRTRAEGKVISAQQIMLEVLERGLKVKS
jgi:hypothetical protein